MPHLSVRYSSFSISMAKYINIQSSSVLVYTPTFNMILYSPQNSHTIPQYQTLCILQLVTVILCSSLNQPSAACYTILILAASLYPSTSSPWPQPPAACNTIFILAASICSLQHHLHPRDHHLHLVTSPASQQHQSAASKTIFILATSTCSSQ